jgi:hypothetical protein
MVGSRRVRCAIVQPSYIPWRGYFDIIRRSDVFVFFDDVQYDRRGWRNRNRIKTAAGSKWLTIPVHARGSQITGLPINEVAVAGDEWAREHLDAIRRAYREAPFFPQYADWLERTYAAPPELLADFTIATTQELAAMLGIMGTRFVRSSTLQLSGRKTERLIAVLKAVGATHYLSGPSARDYIDEQQFRDAAIALEWMEYDYPEYPQLHGAFDPHVSVLDLLFMTGDRAADYIWSNAQ